MGLNAQTSRLRKAGGPPTAPEERDPSVDTAERLALLMVGGAPDKERFAQMVGAAIERAVAGGRRVRIYGEMVAMLWDAGDDVTAIALEDVRNDLASE